MRTRQTIRVNLFPCALALSIFISSINLSHARQDALSDGYVNMAGSIIDSPCTIATEDVYQSIEMHPITIGEIRLNGRSEPYPFFLNLVNCDFDSSHNPSVEHPNFVVTFEGASDDGLFLLNGVSGIGLQVANSAGDIAIPGQPMTTSTFDAKSHRLEYTLRLVRDHHPLKAGDYYAIFRFKISYF